jgi:CMP-N-acetylneuraminic acid synthetase
MTATAPERAERRVVALVPMKGHSERIPSKNFRLFRGKPLFRWIVDTLLQMPEVQQIVINTDARAVFERCGVDALPGVLLRDRRAELCGDFVSMNQVLADDIANVPADVYLMTHATNPLLRARTIRRALETYLERAGRGEVDSLFTVNRFQSRFYGSDGRPINHDPNNLIRTQDLEPWFEENSNLYIFTAASFAATKARIGRRPMMFVTPPLEAADIDDQAGWELAELIAAGRRELQ